MKTKLFLLLAALTFSFSSNAQVTITGTGTGGWNQPGGWTLTNTPAGSTTWVGTNFPIVGDKNMKFSEAATWATTYGFNTVTPVPGFPTGVAGANTTPNPPPALGTINNNIVATGGVWANPLNNNFWNVTYDTATKAYTFSEGINPYKIYTVSGGGLAAPVTLTTTNGIAYFKKAVYFSGGNAVFNEVASPINPAPSTLSWGGPWPTTGAGAASTTLPVAVPAGLYNVNFSRTTGVPTGYTFEPTIVGMVGNFAGSNWGADILMTTTDNINYQIINKPFAIGANTDTSLHCKFRYNIDWANQFGESTGVNGGNALALTGTAQNGAAGGGGDIYVPWLAAGDAYDVNLNILTGTWTFTSHVLGAKSFNLKNFTVYPNPTTSVWSFSSSNNDQIDSVQIVNTLGKAVLTKKAASSDVNVNASGLASGVYFAKVTSGNTTSVIKVVKN